MRRMAATIFNLRLWLAIFAFLLSAQQIYALIPWLPFGPDGGDARRIAADPSDPGHLFLGTANGWVYQSHDDGAAWVRLARISKRDDFAVDSIVVDPANPRHIVIGAWAIDHSDGGIFTSLDGGQTWINQAEMRGQSVLALAASPLNPKIMVAGTLRGVFRSIDGGFRWTEISPPGSVEIHNVQSVAISPRNPNVIYAGTWHLPWRTTDGGEHWQNMKEGIIDDSDVFSIIVDPGKPQIVYASACSGIYKSEDAGLLFHKIQGIPSTARRTRRLLQDPNNLDIVFAGTTEGLYRSEDAGKTWTRTTGPEVIVNDVEVDPRNSKHVLLATDRGGVLASEDGGNTFHSSNTGFSARQITSVQIDRRNQAVVYVGVVNDKDWGGVFESDNGGLNWIQRSDGLEGRDVFALAQAPDGTVIAGTSHGLFRFEDAQKQWLRIDTMLRTRVAAHAAAAVRAHSTAHSAHSNSAAHATLARHSGSAVKKPAPAASPASPSSTAVAAAHAPAAPAEPARGFDGSVYALVTSDRTLLAATSDGLLTSADNGETWQLAGLADSSAWHQLGAAKRFVVAASLRTLQLSADAGATWTNVPLPAKFAQVVAVAVDPTGAVWLGGQEGLFVSSDRGATWVAPKNLFVSSVSNLYFDTPSDRMVVTTAGASSYVFTVQLADQKVTFAEAGWSLRLARPVGDHLIAATLFDGIVVQPRMVASPLAEPASTKVTTTAAMQPRQP